ncbi:MAG: cytochrome c3 family protein [Duodenibacillus sp.]|nr:cytochrome c3 family protein [Duodenibacillus sp.]
MKPIRLLLAAGLAACVACAQAQQAPSMQFKHQMKGIGCVMCHKTAAPAAKPKAKVCNECHQYGDLARKSAAKGLELNPHDSHAGELKCVLCHREHAKSVVHCKECHKSGARKFEFQVP